jgi:hypothetical protein
VREFRDSGDLVVSNQMSNYGAFGRLVSPLVAPEGVNRRLSVVLFPS